METIKAAAVSLYQLTFRSKKKQHCLPDYIHYLPLFLVDENDNPTPVIINEQGSTPTTAVFPPELQTETFTVTNHFNVKTLHRCGGVRAYTQPHCGDLCPEESAFYPKGTRVKATRINDGWIRIQGPKGCIYAPGEIITRQIRMRKSYENPPQHACESPTTTYPAWPCCICNRESWPGSRCDFCYRIVCLVQHASLTDCCWKTTCPQCSCHCNPPPVMTRTSDEVALLTSTPQEWVMMRHAVTLKKQAMIIAQQDKIIKRQCSWCTRRQTIRINEKPGAFRMSPKMIKDLHNLRPSGLQIATREERTCQETDHDRNKDACAASARDTASLVRAAIMADQQSIQYMQDDVDQLKELTSTFEADVKNTFREVANNQEEHDQDFKKIRAQIKNLHRDVCRIRGNAPIHSRNTQVSMDLCCGCHGPIPQE